MVATFLDMVMRYAGWLLLGMQLCGRVRRVSLLLCGLSPFRVGRDSGWLDSCKCVQRGAFYSVGGGEA